MNVSAMKKNTKDVFLFLFFGRFGGGWRMGRGGFMFLSEEAPLQTDSSVCLQAETRILI